MKKTSIILGIILCIIFIGIILYKINNKDSKNITDESNDVIQESEHESDARAVATPTIEENKLNQTSNSVSAKVNKTLSNNISKKSFQNFQNNLIKSNSKNMDASSSPSDQNSIYNQMAVNAIKLIGEGKKEQGVNELNEVLKKDPKNEIALEGLGLYYLEEGKNLDKALDYFQKMIEINPTNPIAISEIAYVIEELQGIERVESYLKDLYDKNSNSPILASALAQTLIRAGKTEDAIAYLEVAARENKKIGEPNYALEELAFSQMEVERTQDAIKSYKTLLTSKQVECDKLNATQNIKREKLDNCTEELFSAKINLVQAYIQAYLKDKDRNNCDEANNILRNVENKYKDDPGLKNIFKELMEKCQ
ncbi:MAG: tetratricopeptide repeat protein [Oligoflexia bacterium]|nr:tetratricopeptide repeat protein [Oligoflexia bacterium]